MAGLDKQQFLDRYGRYFNDSRIHTIGDLGFLFIEGGAEGPYFFDSEGNKFLDMWCMGGNFSLGRRNPAIMAVAERALREEEFGSLFFFSEAKGMLAEKLAECTPGPLETTHPVVTGAEAIDLSIKIARGCSGRTEILYADQAYHGCTGFALSMMAEGDMRDYAEPLVPDFKQVFYGDADDLAAKISERTAAVVLEAVRSDADGRVPPAEYFDEVRRLCDETGAKLIIDEVVCGMGRLGKLWGCEYWNLEPDMLVTAKGFCGGVYPMSAVVTRPECLDFFGESPYRTISSFGWSNIGARISHAAIEETEKLLPRLGPLGDSIEDGLDTLAARYPSIIRNKRRAGMMFALDFADEAAGITFLTLLLENGVLAVASSQHLDIVKLYPPLILEQPEVDLFFERVETVLKQMG
jgi:putrescine aminotransferase